MALLTTYTVESYGLMTFFGRPFFKWGTHFDSKSSTNCTPRIKMTWVPQANTSPQFIISRKIAQTFIIVDRKQTWHTSERNKQITRDVPPRASKNVPWQSGHYHYMLDITLELWRRCSIVTVPLTNWQLIHPPTCLSFFGILRVKIGLHTPIQAKAR